MSPIGLRLGAVLVAVVAGAAACTGEPPPLATAAQDVVGAEVTTGDPGVVALVTSQGRVFCTGTLISPQVVLSAAHCLADAGGDPAVSAFFGADAAAAGRSVGVAMAVTHPGWTGELGGGHDLSLSLLSVAQDPALVVPINRADLAAHLGAPYRVVGFGIHDRVTRELDGKKRTAAMQIDRLVGDYVEVGDVDADQATAICQGDSGGPGFITVAGAEVLAGVHSYSIEGCLNPSGDARPDLYAADFIQPFIDSHDVTCRQNGVCNRVSCSADPDCLPCNADGTCTTACPLPDPDCPTSGLGEICQADTQCLTGQCIVWTPDPRDRFCSQPCTGDAECPVAGMVCREVSGEGRVCDYAGEPPGAIGQACTVATECAAYLCVEGACTYTCDVPRNLLCPDGYRCDTVDGTAFVCLAEPTDDAGGCCATGRGGDPRTALLLSGLVALVVGVRRRGGRARRDRRARGG